MIDLTGRRVCPWAGKDAQSLRYHDSEWGIPLHDEGRLFELLLLEGMQAGLSWSVVLAKRPAIRAALAGFDPDRLQPGPTALVGGRPCVGHQSPDVPRTGSRPYRAIRNAQPRPQEPWLFFCRSDHLLCPDAGGRTGLRPSCLV